MLKIPFGKDKGTGEFKDAKSVVKGRACNCKCHTCGSDLEAVHPRFRVKHFRHVSKRNCTGDIESLFHKIAKQILKENSNLKISEGNQFLYDQCDVEIMKYGKRPDAYLSNQYDSLIVEIYFTHQTDESAVEIYLNNNERVLEIDISDANLAVFDYGHLKDMVLSSAPRRFLFKKELIETEETETIKPENTKDSWDWLGWLLLAIITLGGIIYFSNNRKRRRKRFKRRY
jgi:hypothetical protein